MKTLRDVVKKRVVLNSSIPIHISALICGMFLLILLTNCRDEVFNRTEEEKVVLSPDYVLIPDPVFRKYIRENIAPNAFVEQSEYINSKHSEVVNFEGVMSISGNKLAESGATTAIKSLKGIELFTGMKNLTLENLKIDSLVLQVPMAIDSLWVHDARDLVYTDFSGCRESHFIEISSCTALDELDFSNLPLLNYIDIFNNTRLEAVDFTNSPEIEHIYAYNSFNWKNVDLSKVPKLKRLILQNSISTKDLDLTPLSELDFLVVTYANDLKNLDLSNNTKLKSISIEGTGITALDVSKNVNLEAIVVSWTKIKELDLTANPKVYILEFWGCPELEFLDIRGITTFEYWLVDISKLSYGTNEAKTFLVYKDGLTSPVKTSFHTLFIKHQRKEYGDDLNISAGLWPGVEQQFGYLSLRTIRLSDPVKDNYGWVKLRRIILSIQAKIEVYDLEGNRTCSDYSPEKFICVKE